MGPGVSQYRTNIAQSQKHQANAQNLKPNCDVSIKEKNLVLNGI